MNDELSRIDLIIFSIIIYISLFYLSIPLSAAYHGNTIICELGILFNEFIYSIGVLLLLTIVLYHKYKED